jgi:hypothetical protein
VIRILSGYYLAASTLLDELVTLADDKNTLFWKAWGMLTQGWLLALTSLRRSPQDYLGNFRMSVN